MKNQKLPEKVLALVKMWQPHMIVWLVLALFLVTFFRILYWL
jgi:hypothetical protein